MTHIESLQNKNFFDGCFVGDYKTRLGKEVTQIMALKTEDGIPPSVEVRKAIINAVFDAFIEQTGKSPDGVQVQRLANWLLLEDLTNNHPDKVTREDYPVLTKRQLRTRYHREKADENIPETHTTQSYLGGKKQPHYKISEQ